MIFGFPGAKQGLCHTKHGGAGCIILVFLWNSHTLFRMSASPWCDVSRTFMNSVYPWPWTSISKLYIHYEFRSCKMCLLFDISIPNFGIWVYHHEKTCWVHSWPSYDLDLWPICEWQGVSLVSFTHSFNMLDWINILSHIQSVITKCKIGTWTVMV